jgi:hypothetical protein
MHEMYGARRNDACTYFYFTPALLQFHREVSVYPQILLNKIDLATNVDTTFLACGDLIQRTIVHLLEIYTKYAPTYDNLPDRHKTVLETRWVCPQSRVLVQGGRMELFKLTTAIRMCSVQASGIDTPLPYTNPGSAQLTRALAEYRGSTERLQ